MCLQHNYFVAQWKEQDTSLSAIVSHSLTGHVIKVVQELMVYIMEPEKHF